MKTVIITENESGQRLDRYLSKLLNGASKGTIAKLIRKKVFKINGKRVTDGSLHINVNDMLEIFLSDETYKELTPDRKIFTPDDLELDIVHEDDDVLVVNKPSGLLTHPDKEEFKNTLATKVQSYLYDLCNKTFRPSPIHRLDKNTSGLVIFAKNYQTLVKYNLLMRERKIKKYYEAIVEGRLLKGGSLEGYIIKDEGINKVEIKKQKESSSDDSKYVKTIYVPIRVFGEFTHVHVQLETGRSHQIRASLSYLGHPIVGDRKYGSKIGGGQLLHCKRLEVDGRIFEKKSDKIANFIG